MELFLNDKEILFIKSLRIKKYIALWKNNIPSGFQILNRLFLRNSPVLSHTR